MTLTANQLATLKADILADPTLSQWAATGRMAQEIVDVYNAPASPAFVVWKTNVSADEWREALFGGGGATQLDALTASKRDTLFKATDGALNPANPLIRAALDDFCGSQNTLKGAVQAVQKRNATRAEKLFATGTGTTVNPATLTFEGGIAYWEVDLAINLP